MYADALTPACSLTPDDVVLQVKHLPAAPKVLPRLKRLLVDGNSAIHEIVHLVRLDPGLAARVLQVANSAYFSKGVRCTTVDEAVNRVGYDQIHELVSYAVASQVLVRPLEAYSIEADELWAMSVSCALAAEAIAAHTNQDRKTAYTIGLLHCVGMVALDEWSLKGEQKLHFSAGVFPREAVERERATLGFNQADVGAALLKHWEFPETASEPVRLQYAPRASAAHLKMACLLYAAKWVRSAVCAPTMAMRPPLPEAIFLQAVGVTPDALRTITATVVRQLADVSSLLDMDEEAAIDRAQFPSQRWQA